MQFFYQLWRIINKEQSIWVTWIYSTFLHHKSFWDMSTPSKCPWSLKQIFKACVMARNHVNYSIGRISCFSLWHDPWVMGRSLVERLGPSVISIMRSSPMAPVHGGSNHVLAIELRQLCFAIHPRSVDRITWGDNGDNPLSISTIWQTLRQRGDPPPWVSMIWHTFAVPKYSVLLWLAINKGQDDQVQYEC